MRTSKLKAIINIYLFLSLLLLVGLVNLYAQRTPLNSADGYIYASTTFSGVATSVISAKVTMDVEQGELELRMPDHEVYPYPKSLFFQFQHSTRRRICLYSVCMKSSSVEIG